MSGYAGTAYARAPYAGPAYEGPPPDPEITLAGTVPPVTGSFSLAAEVAPVDVALAGTIPAVTGSFTVNQAEVVIANLAGTVPGVFGSFGVTASEAPLEAATDSVNRLNGMSLVTEWHVEITEPVATPTRQPAHDYAVATSLPNPTLVEGRPT